jgi:tRNA dimethylallyltransferase
MQVYRGMDIGTAKPSSADRAEIRHWALDLVEPHESFSVGDFRTAVAQAFDDIAAAGRRAIVVGGTGLYVQAVVDGLDIPGRFPDVRDALEADPDTAGLHARLAALDPLAASRMEPTNRRRIVRALEVTLGSGRPFSSYGPGLDSYPPTAHRLVGIDRDRVELDRRIAARYERQLAAGFLEEIRRLDGNPLGLSPTASQALGYKELLDHVRGRCTLDEALDLAVRRTRRFARRQQRWFRRDPRVRWIDGPEFDLNPMAVARSLLEDWNLS